MATYEMSEVLLRLLGELSGGKVEVAIGSEPLASLDAGSRDIKVQIGPLLETRPDLRSIVQSEGPLGLFRTRGIPGELARKGWRVSLRDESQEILAVGRDTSALTGHIHLNPRALWALRKLA